MQTIASALTIPVQPERPAVAPALASVPSIVQAGVLAPAPASVTPIPSSALATVDQLLRDRTSILARIHAGHDLGALVRVMLATIAVSSALFGATLGIYRGGVQILYAAIKLPLLMLFTAALCAPTLTALNAALDRPASLRRDIALMLASLALGSLILVAQAPLLIMASALPLDYHDTILLMFGCCAVAGVGSLAMLRRGVRAGGDTGARIAVLTLVAVVSMVGAQMSWTLRPYVVRPRTPEVPFVRSIEGSLIESVLTSLESAQGFYHRDSAPLPGESARTDRPVEWELREVVPDPGTREVTPVEDPRELAPAQDTVEATSSESATWGEVVP